MNEETGRGTHLTHRLVAQGTASRGTGPYAQVPDSSASSSTGFQSYINRADSAFPIYQMKRGY